MKKLPVWGNDTMVFKERAWLRILVSPKEKIFLIEYNKLKTYWAVIVAQR